MFWTKEFCPLGRSNASEENLSPIALEEFVEMLEKNCEQLRGYMLARNGKIVGEYFRKPYHPEDKVWVYSISKSFTSTGIGIAVDEGRLSVDDQVASFFYDKLPAKPDDYLLSMRVRDLLSMTSGHAEDTAIKMMTTADGDWIKAFFELPIEHKPGTHFCYNSGATYILSAILNRITGESLLDYLGPRLFAPLGFDDVLWDKSPAGIETGGWGIKLRLEDLLKLGELYLNKGIYDGKRILSEEWVESATCAQADNSRTDNNDPDWKQGYGFQFWRCRHNAFRADGAAGQFCIVMPEQKAVLAIMSETIDMQKVMDGIWETLFPALNASFLVGVEHEINGREYLLEPNTLGFSGAQFMFQDGELFLNLIAKDKSFTLRAGADRWSDGMIEPLIGTSSLVPYFSFREKAQKVSAHYEWLSANTLQLSWVWRETPHRDRLICKFESDRLQIVCPRSPAGFFAGAKELQFLGKL